MRRAAVASLVFALVMLPSVPASASCGTVPTVRKALATADVAFVGTVVSLENLDRWATVKVDEVWKGEGVPEEVELRAGPKGERTMTTVDRTYVLGRQYLFFPYRDRPAFYRDSACSATTAYGPRLVRFRPASLEEAPSPSVGRDDVVTTDPNTGAYLWVLGAAASLILLGVFLWRRSSSR